ncbi:11879_t:CDS:2 [Entrophospora sp. SA101]|nr:11879_t:CDS:2 [Entrophospora sp. SA101]
MTAFSSLRDCALRCSEVSSKAQKMFGISQRKSQNMMVRGIRLFLLENEDDVDKNIGNWKRKVDLYVEEVMIGLLNG